jgi:hypothetical protein
MTFSLKLLIDYLTLLLNLGIDGKLVLKWFVKEDVDWINLAQYECGNEPLGSRKDGELFG